MSAEAVRLYVYRPFGVFRLLLAVLVMVQHLGANLAPEPLMRALAPYGMGSMAVLVFFTLSGFVICEAAETVYRDRPGAFLSNRLLRIVPHFLVAVTLAILAHELFRLAGGTRLWRSQPDVPPDALTPRNVLMNVLGILPISDRFMSYKFLDIAWAVRVEMAFYGVMFVCLSLARAGAGRVRLPLVALGATVVLAPLFVLAVEGHGIPMLRFLPYFAFGSALYYAATGRRGGWIVALVCVPAMVWQFLMQSLPDPSAPDVPPSVLGNGLMLLVLMAAFVALAFVRNADGKGADAAAGRLTYPLYLYHEVVLVVLLTFTTGYSYAGFLVGFLASLVVSVALSALIDPAVDNLRDRIRGRSVRSARATALAAGP